MEIHVLDAREQNKKILDFYLPIRLSNWLEFDDVKLKKWQVSKLIPSKNKFIYPHPSTGTWR